MATPIDGDEEREREEEERRRQEDERRNGDDPAHGSAENKRERRTKFGAALHNRRRPRTMERGENMGAYELAIEASRHMAESRKESVRILQTCL